MGNSNPRPALPVNQPLLPQYPPQAMLLQNAQNLAQVTTTVTLKCDSSIDRNSFQLLPNPADPNVFFLDFTYNSNQDCLLTVYFFCNEIIDPTTHNRVFTSNLNLYPRPLELQLPGEYHQSVPQQSIALNFSRFENLFSFQDQTTYPVVLEMRPLYRDQRPPQLHTSFLCFAQETGVWKPKLLQQRLFALGRYFVLHEIFGVQRQNHSDEESVECVVCMTDRRNTAVLPCRHMCLCGNCANIVRSQPSSKCPICRCQVDSLMQLIVETEV